jgi:hypothetical protein
MAVRARFQQAARSRFTRYTQTPGGIFIADNRRTDWTQAGANIVNRVTKHGSTITAGTSAAAIMTQINGAPANNYVEFGAGTFQIAGLTIDRNDVTLRGQGMSTIIDFNDGAQDDTNWIWPEGCPFSISPGDYDADVTPALTGAPSASIALTGTHGNASSFPAGATVLNLATTPTGWSVGDSICIVMTNYADGTLPRAGFFLSTKNVNHPATDGIAWQGEYWNYGSALSYRGEVVGISGTNVTISPPLPHGLYVSAQIPRVYRYPSSGWVTGVGIENMRIVGNRITSAGGIDCLVGFHRAKGCWIKGCGLVPKVGSFHSGNACNYVVALKDSYKNSVVNNWFDPNRGGMATGTTTTYAVSTLSSAFCLVENNVFKNPESPMVPHVGSCANVFAYNYEQYVGDDQQETGCIFHSIGCVFNLVEGNQLMKVTADLFHGNTMFNTVHRNYCENRGTDLQSYHRFWNVTGNVIDATEVRRTLATDSTKYDRWARFGTRLGYNAQGASIDPNYNGDNSLDGVAHDPDVWATLMLWDNYTTVGGWVSNASEVPSGDPNYPNPVPAIATPASLFRTSAPSYFTMGGGIGTIPFPPIGPGVSGGELMGGRAYKLPARRMYEFASGNIANFDPTLYG